MKNKLTIAIGVFILVMTIASIFGIDPSKSLWSGYERGTGVFFLLHLFAFYWLIGKGNKRLAVQVSVLLSIVVCMHAFAQKLGLPVIESGRERVTATIGNPIFLASYLVLNFYLTLYLMRNIIRRIPKSKMWQFILLGFAGLTQLFTIYLTGTRGAYLAMMVSIPLLFVFYLKNKKRVIAMIILVIIVSGGMHFLTSYKQSTIQTRIASYKIGYQGWTHNLKTMLIGYGPENYAYVFNRYATPQTIKIDPFFDRAHNIVIDTLSNAGILGLIAYLSIFGVAISKLWRKKDWLLVCALVAYFTQNLFVFDTPASYMTFFLLLGIL